MRRMIALLKRSTVVTLLVAAVAFGVIAWQMQSSAASDLARTLEVQQDEVGGGGGEPPDVSDYRRILQTLNRSIAIRKDIDSSLSRIESAVEALRSEQEKAAAISTAGKQQIEGIATTLGSAAGAAETTARDLSTLDGHLAKSKRLSRLIAEELEELDRTFGPTLDEGLKDLLDDILRDPP